MPLFAHENDLHTSSKQPLIQTCAKPRINKDF
jgi:hypothetical protein